jgi:hypothetical protein
MFGVCQIAFRQQVDRKNVGREPKDVKPVLIGDRAAILSHVG